MNIPIVNNFEAPKVSRINPPQSAKPHPPANVAVKEPPQSARQIHSAHDWNKKPGSKKESKIESPEEKLKKQADRKKERDDCMKQWRQKWTDKDRPVSGGNLVEIIGAAQEQIQQQAIKIDQTPEKKTRNIEMIKSKQVAQTAQNWNSKKQDENEVVLVTPVKNSSAEKKLVTENVLKERSP